MLLRGWLVSALLGHHQGASITPRPFRAPPVMGGVHPPDPWSWGAAIRTRWPASPSWRVRRTHPYSIAGINPDSSPACLAAQLFAGDDSHRGASHVGTVYPTRACASDARPPMGRPLVHRADGCGCWAARLVPRGGVIASLLYPALLRGCHLCPIPPRSSGGPPPPIAVPACRQTAGGVSGPGGVRGFVDVKEPDPLNRTGREPNVKGRLGIIFWTGSTYSV